MENIFSAGILDLDINALMMILEKLSGSETLQLCSSNVKLRDICKRYENIIWTKKLLKDYHISQDEIIGLPKSYYLGLEQKKGFYYFYYIDEVDNKFIVSYAGTKEPEYKRNFYIPGILELGIPVGEKLIFAHFSIEYPSDRYKNIYFVGKNEQKTLKLLIDEVKKKYWKDFNQNLEKRILNTPLNFTFDWKITRGPRANDEIPISFRLSFSAYKFILPGPEK